MGRYFINLYKTLEDREQGTPTELFVDLENDGETVESCVEICHSYLEKNECVELFNNNEEVLLNFSWEIDSGGSYSKDYEYYSEELIELLEGKKMKIISFNEYQTLYVENEVLIEISDEDYELLEEQEITLDDIVKKYEIEYGGSIVTEKGGMKYGNYELFEEKEEKLNLLTEKSISYGMNTIILKGMKN